MRSPRKKTFPPLPCMRLKSRKAYEVLAPSPQRCVRCPVLADPTEGRILPGPTPPAKNQNASSETRARTQQSTKNAYTVKQLTQSKPKLRPKQKQNGRKLHTKQNKTKQSIRNKTTRPNTTNSNKPTSQPQKHSKQTQPSNHKTRMAPH